MDDKIIFSFSPPTMTCLSSYLELSETAFADGDFGLEWGSLRGRLCESLGLETVAFPVWEAWGFIGPSCGGLPSLQLILCPTCKLGSEELLDAESISWHWNWLIRQI